MFIGHILSKRQLENIVITGKLDGRIDRGKPPEKIRDRKECLNRKW
jgi:hypothetical protein